MGLWLSLLRYITRLRGDCKPPAHPPFCSGLFFLSWLRNSRAAGALWTRSMISSGMSSPTKVCLQPKVLQGHCPDSQLGYTLSEHGDVTLAQFNDPNLDRANLGDLEEDSPYPEVRSAVANTDDVDMPVNTIRVWILGMIMAIIIPGLNQFLYVCRVFTIESDFAFLTPSTLFPRCPRKASSATPQSLSATSSLS